MVKQNGFTLIELLVVVAIVTILPVVLLSNFPEAKQQFALNRSAYEFLQQARLVQNMALAGAPYKDGFGIVQPVAGYGIYIDAKGAGSATYVVYADRVPGNSHYDPADYIVKTVNIGAAEPGVVISSVQNVFANRASINFASGNGDVAINQLDKNSTGAHVVFGLQNDPSKTKGVVINTSGLIEIK